MKLKVLLALMLDESAKDDEVKIWNLKNEVIMLTCRAGDLLGNDVPYADDTLNIDQVQQLLTEHNSPYVMIWEWGDCIVDPEKDYPIVIWDKRVSPNWGQAPVKAEYWNPTNKLWYCIGPLGNILAHSTNTKEWFISSGFDEVQPTWHRNPNQ